MVLSQAQQKGLATFTSHRDYRCSFSAPSITSEEILLNLLGNAVKSLLKEDISRFCPPGDSRKDVHPFRCIRHGIGIAAHAR